MIEISLYIFLILYGAALALFVIFALINIYHLFRFGFLSFFSFFVTFLFLAGVILILFITYELGAKIDWSQTFII
ncbi:MAG: hypothetical protein A2Y67_03785 [Candidatus Buchananbacteria bacterium RBG_13_39_9]|uniref:Uncharacterized protein n=1 Tax=Candidatus Buchananbacteria bacterium RBG_13_39_9 TaxID=1797531 RepID=A0A1G1XT63_9BACT|nr:MAG: hypothetical protein A2Y67_03785 [Candidatus Buchananbacteria bacterium RBG_13_39_9]